MSTRHLFALLALASCAEPSNATVKKCVDECDASSDCPGGTGDCLDVCENEYDEAERIECIADYKAMIECLGADPGTCDPNSCSTEISTYTVCFGEFCGINPADPACPEPIGSGGGIQGDEGG